MYYTDSDTTRLSNLGVKCISLTFFLHGMYKTRPGARAPPRAREEDVVVQERHPDVDDREEDAPEAGLGRFFQLFWLARC